MSRSPTEANARPAARSTGLRLLLFLLPLLAFGIASVLLGQDTNWDQRNYHVYNAHALLTGRLGYDYIPAHSLTFLPQLYNVPFYLMTVMAPRLDPRLTGFILGAVHGLNAVLLFLVARAILAPPSTERIWIPLLATAVGLWSPAFLSELGTTMGDNVTSIFILAGILVLVCSGPERPTPTRAALAGLSVGVAAGLKYTNVVYAAALLAALAALRLSRRISSRALVVAALGAATGFVAVAGHHMWRLWQLYANPFFPFANALFRSPYLAAVNFQDRRWQPTDIADAAWFPFYPLLEPQRTLEIPLRDARWALLALLAGLGIARYVIERTLRARRRGHSRPVVLLLWFCGVGFVLWELAFGYHRFLIPLELLSGIALLALLGFPYTTRTLAAFVLLSLLIVATVRVPSWGREPWGPTWFGTRVPEPVADDAMVLMVGNGPTAHVIPFFPPQVRFVRVEADLLPLARDAKLGREIADTVAAHRGPLSVLLRGRLDAAAQQTLAAYGVHGLPAQCRRVESRLDAKLFLCAAERSAAR